MLFYIQIFKNNITDPYTDNNSYYSTLLSQYFFVLNLQELVTMLVKKETGPFK